MIAFEHRALIEPPEFRAEGTKLTAFGIAIRYGAVSKDLGGFKERIMPGAASKTIAEQDIVALRDHDPSLLLGRTSSGTLRLHEDTEALRYEIDLPDTTIGRDTATMLERRDLAGSSFGFKPTESPKWSTIDDGKTALRSVHALRLRDVGPVTFPAYDASSAEMALRSLADDRGIELRSLLEAADRGELPTLLDERYVADRQFDTTWVDTTLGSGSLTGTTLGTGSLKVTEIRAMEDRNEPVLVRARSPWLYA